LAHTYEHAGAVCQQLGHYNEAEGYFEEALICCMEISPTSNLTLEAMEILTNSLHIQGKTELAVKKLDTHIQIVESIIKKYIKDDDDEFTDVRSYSDDGVSFGSAHSTDEEDNPHRSNKKIDQSLSPHNLAINSHNLGGGNEQTLIIANNALQRILARAMYLNSIIENYQEAEKYLDKALQHAEVHALPLSPQILCDAACLYWEIHKDQKARAFEEKIMRTAQVPLSRSKYLGSLSSSFIEKSCRLHLRVNRTRPEHKEGEKPTKIQRKLDSFFLEVIFYSIKTGKVLNLPISTINGDAEFQIVSPVLDLEDGVKNWYRASLCIYKDKQKNVLLGEHHQLILYDKK